MVTIHSRVVINKKTTIVYDYSVRLLIRRLGAKPLTTGLTVWKRSQLVIVDLKVFRPRKFYGTAIYLFTCWVGQKHHIVFGCGVSMALFKSIRILSLPRYPWNSSLSFMFILKSLIYLFVIKVGNRMKNFHFRYSDEAETFFFWGSTATFLGH